jgi:hypothetical protein
VDGKEGGTSGEGAEREDTAKARTGSAQTVATFDDRPCRHALGVLAEVRVPTLPDIQQLGSITRQHLNLILRT